MIAFGFLSTGTTALTGLGATITAFGLAETTWIALLFGAAFFALAGFLVAGFLTVALLTTTFLATAGLMAFFAADFFTCVDDVAADLVVFVFDFLGAAFFAVSFFFVAGILTSSINFRFWLTFELFFSREAWKQGSLFPENEFVLTIHVCLLLNCYSLTDLNKKPPSTSGTKESPRYHPNYVFKLKPVNVTLVAVTGFPVIDYSRNDRVSPMKSLLRATGEFGL
jgi:hypothetical protein